MTAKPRLETQDPDPRAAAPSLGALGAILRRALAQGRLTWSGNFKRRCALHGGGLGFNTLDAVNAIRGGKVVLGPKWNSKHAAWIYHLAGLVEGYTFVVEEGLGCNEDVDAFS